MRYASGDNINSYDWHQNLELSTGQDRAIENLSSLLFLNRTQHFKGKVVLMNEFEGDMYVHGTDVLYDDVVRRSCILMPQRADTAGHTGPALVDILLTSFEIGTLKASPRIPLLLPQPISPSFSLPCSPSSPHPPFSLPFPSSSCPLSRSVCCF